MIERGIVGERLVRNVGDQLAVVADPHVRLADDLADDHAIESPFFEDAQHFVLAAFLGDEQHALLDSESMIS